MKELKLDSVFFNNDELYDHLPDCDEAMLMVCKVTDVLLSMGDRSDRGNVHTYREQAR